LFSIASHLVKVLVRAGLSVFKPLAKKQKSKKKKRKAKRSCLKVISNRRGARPLESLHYFLPVTD
jgi:hypothetical protein